MAFLLSIIQDWLSLLLRWAHIVAGIGWIGSSFYFMWLDSTLRRRESFYFMWLDSTLRRRENMSDHRRRELDSARGRLLSHGEVQECPGIHAG